MFTYIMYYLVEHKQSVFRTISYNHLSLPFIVEKLTGRVEQKAVIFVVIQFSEACISTFTEQKRQLQNSCNFINNYTSSALNIYSRSFSRLHCDYITCAQTSI